MMAQTKATLMIACLAIAAPAAATSLAAAQEIQVQAVVDGKVGCFSHAVVSRPCDGFKPPPRVAIGEGFTADGKTRKIGVIRAYQADKDMKEGIKKGEWICVAAETSEDIPVDQSRNRTWLAISSASLIWAKRNLE
jgi:hypothetical protein